MPLCKSHSFWMVPWLICCFVVILFTIERKWLLMRNKAIFYPWSLNCLENFSVSVLLMEVSKGWKILEFSKISIKMKDFKIFYKGQSASWLKEFIQSPTSWKLPTSLEQIFSYGDMQEYTDICFPSALRMQFLGV